ncbi:MAG: hypothetical protein ACI9FU_000623 [Granulosicoccus sp.]|jgi:hypothetical protein
MKSSTDRSYLFSLVVLISFVSLLSAGCQDHCYDGERNSDEDATDCGGSSCIPCDSSLLVPPEPTCFDGIMNQDETGVDCGGTVCLPCVNDTNPPPPIDQLCTGDESTNFLPLADGNFWSYTMSNSANFTLTVTSSATLLGQTYFQVSASSPFPYSQDYFRNDGAGNTYRLESDGAGAPQGTEYLYINASALAGGGWAVSGGGLADSIASPIIGGTINSTNGCAYSNAATFEDYTSGINSIQRSYSPGMGVVNWGFTGGITAYLDSVSLN